ncbi:Dihydroxyacetone kinase [Colletotrichum higginsianum IMI 349063]|uniref:Dihydroxyacetone kinase n=2 Tax=Colletotrichum higginsianum TaxID=80884 RepID=A0A1B7YFY9_COLHI|nr:Dihydroxyacetone kinase [Colletotrichum higginsianum IMI 349063]OBR10925.1 Dihydroxyacetone kinase [Colletotrichum higginsianum IMI 349063]TID06886.1 Dihydroxyacetone kinase 1 [Colletotrichum higginsianum]GJD01151.1 dihydroxyacetone kinase [Colletotrichum higginsianum]
MSKHFYDEAEDLVLDALESLVLTHSGLSLDKSKKTLWLTNNDPNHVSLLSGGGAGHEPAHAGFVGAGMLTAAVSGSIFASPSVAQILSGISRVASPAGVLLIIKNYTGDVFHFHLAAEKAKASLGVPVEVLVVGDDVSVGRRKSGKVGRRGLAGTVLVHKVLGAYKETGASLADVARLGRAVTENLVTVGASLEHVHIPGREAAAASSDDQVELGMGIHNEPGCQVLKPRPALPKLIDAMLTQLLDTGDSDRAYVDFSDAKDIVLLVNNLGGVSPLEFGGITTKVTNALSARGLKLARVISGTYMTSLNGPGFSITLLKATPEILKYVDAGTDAVGWAYTPRNETGGDVKQRLVESGESSHGQQDGGESGVKLDVDVLKKVVAEAARRINDAEPQITAHDTQVGDGDCGVTLARGAKAVLKYAESSSVTPDAVRTAIDLTNVIEDNMDGTSGAIYSIFFAALASELRKAGAGQLGLAAWAKVAAGALDTLQQATPARQGDRTLIDALEPFVRTLGSSGSVKEAVEAARKGVEATKGMAASLGRAVYVEESAWGKVPDPGAEGVLAILEGLEAATS